MLLYKRLRGYSESLIGLGMSLYPRLHKMMNEFDIKRTLLIPSDHRIPNPTLSVVEVG